MTKVLFLTQYDNNGPSSRIRVYQFLPYLEQFGITTKVCPLLTGSVKELIARLFSDESMLQRIIATSRITISFAKRYFDVLSAMNYDVVVVQKDVLPFGLFPLLRLVNKNIIYEFDDAIWEETPSGKKDSFILKKIFSYRRNLFHRIVKNSKAILAENSYLADYAKKFNKNITIISAPIDTSKYLPSKKTDDKDIVLGWIGSPSTSYLLEQLRAPLTKLSQKYKNISIHNIGGLKLKWSGVNIKNIAWSEKSEIPSLSKFDIGLMPLDNSEFNKGRLGYKMIIYFSLGIPTVASDLGLNKEVIKNGKNGFLVSNESEWVSVLSKLIEDQNLRHKVGNAGREIALNKFDILLCARQYRDLILSMVENKSWQLELSKYHLGKRLKLSMILKYLTKNHKKYDRCLDIGTGTGALASHYKKFGQNWDYLDTDKTVAREARKILGQKILTDPEDIKNKKYDLITIIDTYYCFKEPDKMTQELKNKLSRDGELLITLTDGYPKRFINRIRNKFGLGAEIRQLVFEESPKEFIKRLEKGGFKIIYFKSLSSIVSESMLLFLDIAQINSQKHRNSITTRTKVSPKSLLLLKMSYPIIYLFSLLDWPLSFFSKGYKFIVVAKKK